MPKSTPALTDANKAEIARSAPATATEKEVSNIKTAFIQELHLVAASLSKQLGQSSRYGHMK